MSSVRKGQKSLSLTLNKMGSVSYCALAECGTEKCKNF